jgi:hypothetical protein
MDIDIDINSRKKHDFVKTKTRPFYGTGKENTQDPVAKRVVRECQQPIVFSQPSGLGNNQDIGEFYHKYYPNRYAWDGFNFPLPDEFKGISPEVLTLNVDFISDLEFDPLTHEVTSTPIADFLGFRFTRFGHKANVNQFAAKFGDWQLKIFGEDTDGKRTGKYLAPTGIGDVPYLPNIPTAIARKPVAKVSFLLESSLLEWLANDGLFWDWFQEHKEIPLIVTEGAKKALAAISQGHIALALFGCNCGVTDLTVKPELFPYVEGRQVIIAFDQDGKPETRHKVFKATKRLGNALTYHANSKPVISKWKGEDGKGLDDLIANDPELFCTAIDRAIPFEKWKLGQYTDLSGLVSKRVNSRYLEEITPPENAKLIAIKSGKGTGKTEAIANKVRETIDKGEPVVVISHREQLCRELAQRFCLEYRTDLSLEGRQNGYVLCVDSLHPKANPPFKPENWPGVTVVIDEVEQVIWHLLNSDTCRYNRVAILQSLTDLLNGAEKIYLADADLTRRSIDYVVGLHNEPIQPWVLVNDWQRETKRRAHVYDSPDSLLSDTMAANQNGDRLMILTGSQKVTSQWGTINLESLINSQFPDRKILRIDRESVTTPGHPAYGCMGNLNQILPNYDVVIASPTLETGVSIDVKHFDRVFCFATGSQTVEAVGQTIDRVRDDIPRHIWIKKYSSQRIGNGSHDPRVLLKSTEKVFKANVMLLYQADAIAAFDDNNPKHIKTWATFSACHNYGFKNYRENFYELLQENGYQLIKTEKPDDSHEWGMCAKELKEHNQDLHYQAISEAPILTEIEYKLIKEKRAKTDQERLSEEKTAIAHRYATNEVTPDLAKADDNGLYAQLQLHYFLTIGNAFLKDCDTKKTDKLNHEGQVFKPDYNRVTYAAKVKALQALDIEQFLDCDRPFTSESLRDWFNNRVLPCTRDIKDYLNQSINRTKDTPMGVAQRLVGTMNLKMTCIGQQTIDGKRQRLYKMIDLNPDDRQAIFTRWKERDLLAHSPNLHTPPINTKHMGDVA